MIPDYQTLMRPALEALQGGEILRTAEVKEAVAEAFGLNREERAQLQPDGRQTVVSNRIGWALTHLTKAGLIEHPSHGRLRITTEGEQALERHDHVDVQVLFGYSPYATWRSSPAPSVDAVEVDEECTQVWLVGAMIGNKDISEEFITGEYWRISDPSAHERTLLQQMAVGDRIAIKASFVQRHELPFENHGQPVSAMRIKARGTVTSTFEDDRVGVAWERLEPPRDWYLYTYMRTVWKLRAEPMAAALERFVFDDEPQDLQWFLADDYWAGRYGGSSQPTPPRSAKASHSLATADVAYSLDDLIEDGCFVPRSQLEQIVDALEQQRNIILQGAPGTGKTWLARRLGWVLAGRKRGPEVQVVQFHPNTSYEDFVRGYRPQANDEGHGGLELTDGPFLRLADRARQDPSTRCTMVIEEINRGNPARALGEMLTLLEVSKRNEADAIRLTYDRPSDGEGVWLPGNLHVVGTMNTADRSLALMDMALRRRFAFFVLAPQFGDTWQDWMTQCISSTSFIDAVARRVTDLNETIARDPSLGEAFVVGHSYFTPSTAEPLADPQAWFRTQVETSVVPLLREYWFDRPAEAEKARRRLLS